MAREIWCTKMICHKTSITLIEFLDTNEAINDNWWRYGYLVTVINYLMKDTKLSCQDADSLGGTFRLRRASQWTSLYDAPSDRNRQQNQLYLFRTSWTWKCGKSLSVAERGRVVNRKSHTNAQLLFPSPTHRRQTILRCALVCSTLLSCKKVHVSIAKVQADLLTNKNVKMCKLFIHLQNLWLNNNIPQCQLKAFQRCLHVELEIDLFHYLNLSFS